MLIAIDFDGTIVEHRFPAIGKIRPFAFESLKLLQREGHQLILWSYRSGKELEAAVEFCKQHGVQFYSINKSYPEEEFDAGTVSRKVHADLYIDDRNLGGIPSWGEIYQQLCPDQGRRKPAGTGFLTRLFNKG